MFTGIVEEIGEVASLKTEKNLAVLNIKAKKVLGGVKNGDSIAVNGVCLTVTSKQKSTLTFDLMKETLLKSSLGELKVGSKINLERALKVSDRLNGHVVTGHIDQAARITSIIKKENYVELKISLDKNLRQYIVSKGSVCLDGVSLTVGGVSQNAFSVFLIPFTLDVTTLGLKRVGDKINIEADVLAKYVLNRK
jgi:riboflavin synthase